MKSSPKIASKDGAAAVRAYLAGLPPKARTRLKEMRALIRAAAPEAAESVSYGIPTYKIAGRPFVYCAAFKNHTSLYPMTASIRRAHATALKGYNMSTGTIQFPLDKPLPVTLVKRLLRARLAEVRAKQVG